MTIHFTIPIKKSLYISSFILFQLDPYSLKFSNSFFNLFIHSPRFIISNQIYQKSSNVNKNEEKADSNPTKPSSLQHPPFNKIVKNTLDLQNNEERLKEVESIVKSMSPTLIHSIQAASHYGLCYKHINSFQYVNTTEPLGMFFDNSVLIQNQIHQKH